MGINDILQKNNPMQKKIDRENRSDFAKLVDRNTELVDEIKWLKADNDILKSRIDKAIEYIEKVTSYDGQCYFDLGISDCYELLNILKNGDKK